MRKTLISCLLLSLWFSLAGSVVWAIDVGWMQKGVRVWYFGGVGSVTSSDAEEAYLFSDVNGINAQVTKHSGLNHWATTNPVTTITYSIADKGPCWIHPQVLQNLQMGDHWMGFEITLVTHATYTYNTLPYRLLPAKALFDLTPQREIVKLSYMIAGYSTGNAYYDAETGLCLMYSQLNGSVTVFFILSEINYDFATHQAFAEDNGPHTGFKSFVSEQQLMPFPDTRGGTVVIQSSVETRYGSTLEMWVSTAESGNLSSYNPPFENYCFFGSVPILRRINMDVASNYPPEQWNPYGQFLWWWIPAVALQNSIINVVDVPMTRTSTAPYTFTASQQPEGLYFSKLWFDNDGYMTAFAAKDSNTGLDIDPERSAVYYQNLNAVNGSNYYRNTMGNATPVEILHHLTLIVVSDTADKGGGSVHGDGNIACNGHGSSPLGMSGICQGDFTSGTSVSLSQSPDSDSTWATWAESGCGSDQNCTVLMNGDRSITVTFPYSSMVKVNSSGLGFESLAQAYGNAASVDTIYCRAVNFPGNFTLNDSKAVTLLGGRNAWYLPVNSWTTLQGILGIQRGSLTIERLIIK